LKLTTKSEYSLLSLIYFARNIESDFITTEVIAEHYHMPKKYLEQLLVVLKQSRYLRAKRGAGGGYKLNKKPEEITVAEIVRLMDGALAPTESVSTHFYSHTPIEKEEKVLTIFRKIRDYIAMVLEKTTLKDLL
jgi:Rrf2 family transcriptional regulator, cysteine metabolism repressor